MEIAWEEDFGRKIMFFLGYFKIMYIFARKACISPLIFLCNNTRLNK